MPSFSRRDFLVIAGVTGTAAAVTYLGLDRFSKITASQSQPLLETPMPSSSLHLIFTGGYAKAGQPGINAFLFDQASGALGAFTEIANPSFILVHPNQRWLYAVSELGKNSDGMYGQVWALGFEREPFTIKAMNHQTTRGDWPCHLRVDGTGRWLVATNYGTGDAALYPIDEDGSLGEMSDFVKHQGSGPNEDRQEGPHAHSSIFTPDNRFIIIADLGIDQLVIYEFDSSTGKLKSHAVAHSQPGAGPRHQVFHPNGQWLCVANELNSTVSLYEYDAVNGTLTEKQSISTIPSDVPKNIVADIHLSDSGDRLYVSNRGHNSIAVYDVNEDGHLALVAMPSCGGNWPRNFALSPNGKFALVANQYSNEVSVLPMLGGDAALGEPIARVPVTGASCIQFA